MNPLPRLFTAPLLLALPLGLAAADFTVNGRKFTVPDGFTVELAAGTNVVQRPVSAGFDDQGRLYVTESDGSNDAPEKQLKNPGSSLLRLADTNGDGTFDQSVVFADKVMFPQGCLWHDGWVYVAAPPSIWRFRDADGDGRAELREEWFKGGTLTGCANDIHGPSLGPDGYIYWTKGAFAEQTHTLASGRVLKDKAAHIYRMKPDGTGLDVIMSGGMDNPVEIAFTPEGEAIFTSTFIDFSQPGFRDGIAHAVYGGVFGKVNDVLDDGRVTRTGPDLFQPFYQGGPSAECGLTRYESEAFGPGYRDNLFATTFNLHKVTRHVLEARGATFASTNSDFLATDDVDFHPTDVLEDADGSLLVVDTGGWYRLCCPSSQLAKPDVLGAIYRIRKAGAPKPADPRGLNAGWEAANLAGIAGRLDDPRPAVRTRAVSTLAGFGTNALPVLAERLKAGTPLARRNAVWALAQMNDKAAWRTLKIALSDRDPSIVQTALKAAAIGRDGVALGHAATSLMDRNPQLARTAVEAFGRTAAKDMAMMLFNPMQQNPGGADGPDRFLEHAIIYALIELADPQATRLGFRHNLPANQRAALIALDQMRDSGLRSDEVLPFVNAPDERLRRAALWVIGRHPEWGDDLAGWLREQLRAPGTDPARQQQLEGLLRILTQAKAGQQLLADLATQPGFRPETRAAALNAIADAGLKDPPAGWKAAVLTALKSPGGTEPAQSSATVNAARSLNGDATVQAALRVLARDPATAAPLRLDALAALPAGAAFGPAEFEFLRASLDAANTPVARTTAAGVLARAKLEPAQLAALTDDLHVAGPLELNRLLGAFDGGGDEGLGQKLVAALAASKGAKALAPGQLRPHFAKFPAATQQAADAFLATLNTDAAQQGAHLDSLLAETKAAAGDVRRGQAIFNGPKAACSSCHRIGYLGGDVGPELTKIGEVRSERDLLEAMVYPNQSFVRSYEPTLVVLKDGEQVNGIVRRETPEEIILVTGPGPEQRLRRSEVAELRPGTLSVMPGGFDQTLSRQELADLLTFVKTVRWR